MLYERLSKWFASDKYEGTTDLETVIFGFGAFLIPVGPFFIWDTPMWSRILSATLFPIGGFALSFFFGWLIAEGKRLITRRSQPGEPATDPMATPFTVALATTGTIFAAAYLLLTVSLTVGAQLPLAAYFPVIAFGVACVVISYFSLGMYYSYFFDRHYNFGRSTDTLKETLAAKRAILGY